MRCLSRLSTRSLCILRQFEGEIYERITVASSGRPAATQQKDIYASLQEILDLVVRRRRGAYDFDCPHGLPVLQQHDVGAVRSDRQLLLHIRDVPEKVLHYVVRPAPAALQDCYREGLLHAERRGYSHAHYRFGSEVLDVLWIERGPHVLIGIHAAFITSKSGCRGLTLPRTADASCARASPAHRPCAMRKIDVSSKRFAITCSPIGRPSSEKPIGTDIAGAPE